MSNIKRVCKKPTVNVESLEDNYKRIKSKIESIGNYGDYDFHSSKDMLLKQAANCKPESKFRLLATMNDNITIFNWCNAQFNFIGMCQDETYKSDKDLTVEYTLEQLPEVIDRAEIWLKGVKENSSFSGSPYFISSLQLMSI